MREQITYMFAEHIRRGASILTYVIKRKDPCDRRKLQYSLGTCYSIIPFSELNFVGTQRCYKGISEEYDGRNESTITKTFYEAFVRESKKNHREYEKAQAWDKKHFRKCRICKQRKRIGEPCKMCAEIKRIPNEK